MKTKTKTKKEGKSLVEMAMELTIIDAIEKGHTERDEILSFMKSEVFLQSVRNYKKLILESFPELEGQGQEVTA